MMARRLLWITVLVLALLVVLASAVFARNLDVAQTGSRAHDLVKGPFVSINVVIDTEVVLGDVSRYTAFVSNYTHKLVTVQQRSLSAAPADCPTIGIRCTFSDS